MNQRNLLLTTVFLVIVIGLFACKQSQTDSEKDSTKIMEQDSPAIAVDANFYTEPHRLQYHFSPEKMWMNDPNGMVYFEGEYHLFYQYYPDSTVWGPMHWAHSVSKDLLHWEHLPIGLYPDSLGYIFSGSAVVDWKNTSGLGENGQAPLIAIYTYHDMKGEKAGKNDFQTQGIAYSNDKGRTWTKYEGNPVVPNPGIKDFRDPKVMWHEASERWVMVFAAGDKVHFYNSPNLKDWTLTGKFGLGHGSQARPWECPDLFELPVEGTSESKWVLIVSLGKGGPNSGSATQYFIGDFDGKNFTNGNDSKEILWIDYGRDDYAGVTWSDVPKEDGRRLFIGWMSNWEYAQVVPTDVWRSAMTLPRTLTLQKTPKGIRLFSNPIAETQKLRTGKKMTLDKKTIENSEDLTAKMDFNPSMIEIDIQYTLSKNTPTDVGFALSNSKGETYKIGYNSATQQFYSDRTKSGKVDFSDKFASKVHTAPRISDSKTIRLHLFFDLGSVELFADNGATVLTDLFFPNEDFTQLQLYVEGEGIELKEGNIYELKNIWRASSTANP
ncbi:MAG: glycoside hydrolase family 32 protein [Chitinophagales bacterium]